MNVHKNKSTEIATLLLNSPPVNTLSMPVLESFKKNLTQLRQENIKGLVIGSVLQNVFSAGLDLKYLARKESETDSELRSRLRLYMILFQDCIKLLCQAEYPTVVILRGAAPAGI